MLVKIKNYLSNNTGILIRLDDIAENMNWELMDRSEALFNKFNIKPVIGVIPKNQDKDLNRFLIDVQEELMDAILYIEAAKRCLKDQVEDAVLKHVYEK